MSEAAVAAAMPRAPALTAEALVRALSVEAPASSDYDLAPEIRAALPPGRRLRPAAVLVPLVERADGLHVVLTRRAAHLKTHPGQIAFPGGRVDHDDPSRLACALREADEEIGLDPARVRPLGRLPRHETVTGYDVEPHVALVAPGAPFRAAEAEVSEVFDVPLAFLLDPAHYSVHARVWRGRRRAYYAVPYGPYYIWGATARMCRLLADLAG